MPPDDIPDYYAEFGITPSASPADVSRTLDRAQRTWLGKASRAIDKQRQRDAEDKVELAAEAKAVLLDPARRRAYDLRLERSRRKIPPKPTHTPTDGSSATIDTGDLDWVRRARRLLEAGDEESALSVLWRAVGEDPDNPDAWCLMGDVHARRGQFADALREFRRALSARPDDRHIHRMIAQVHEASGNHVTAADWYVRTDKLGGGAAILRNTADSLYRAGRYDEALGAYERLHEMGPRNDEVRNQIARIWALRAEGAMAWHPGRRRYVIVSPDSTPVIRHCIEQALAVDPADTELVDRVRAYGADADRALGRTWRWRSPMVGMLVVAALILTSPLPGDVRAVGLLVMLGLVVALGYRRRWKHARRGIPHLDGP